MIQPQSGKGIDIGHEMTRASAFGSEGVDRFGIMAKEGFTHFRADLEAVRTDGRAEPGLQGLGRDGHGSHQVLDNPSTKASPAAVGGADDCSFTIRENNGQAVGGEDGAGDARITGVAGVSLRNLSDVVRR